MFALLLKVYNTLIKLSSGSEDQILSGCITRIRSDDSLLLIVKRKKTKDEVFVMLSYHHQSDLHDLHVYHFSYA